MVINIGDNNNIQGSVNIGENTFKPSSKLNIIDIINLFKDENNRSKKYVSIDYIISCENDWLTVANNKLKFSIPLNTVFCENIEKRV